MNSFDEFEKRLQESLKHLYDPIHRPSKIVWDVLDCAPQQGVEAIQNALIQAIEEMKPSPEVPSTARSRRIYNLLSYRFVHDLTQEETAERLGISARHLRREQPEAVYALALHLWEARCLDSLPPSDLRQESEQSEDALSMGIRSPDWQSQLKQDLSSLQKSAPGTVAPVSEIIHSGIVLANVLALKKGVTLKTDSVQPNLVADIHPSAMRQVLIKATRQLVDYMSFGEITFRAWRDKKRIRIDIVGAPVMVAEPPRNDLVREILAALGGSCDIQVATESISFRIAFPSVDHGIVVVDDNPDMIHLYQRYAMGTRYHIYASDGAHLFKTVEAHCPSVIVLDVMLPDTDGWDLLAHLSEHPTTRSIPVVVCSVVREEDLALALGAAGYLSKPVQRHDFIRALERVLDQDSAEAPKS